MEYIIEMLRKNFKILIAESMRWLRYSATGQQFFAFILLPAFLLAAYFMLFAPDRYVSKASIMIKETGVAQLNTGLLEGLGFDTGGTSSDEQLLKAYLISPNLLGLLESELGVKKHFSQSHDFIFGLSESDSFENFLEFYREHVKVSSDATTGLLSLHVEAYSAEFSELLANKLLSHSEKFINESSQLIAKLEMQFALDEISLSQDRLKTANQALIDFQNQYSLVSPESDGESLFTIIFSLEAELAKTEAELHQAESYLSKNSPQVSVLVSKSEALKKEIEVQKLRVTGEADGDDKLNELSAEFQSLILDVELATTLYTSSLSAYEVSRVQAAKQLKHLVVASKPYLAEDALYPERIYWLTTWLIFLAIAWGIFRLILATSLEHKD